MHSGSKDGGNLCWQAMAGFPTVDGATVQCRSRLSQSGWASRSPMHAVSFPRQPEVHARRVLHRDLKPSNVMLTRPETPFAATAGDAPCQVSCFKFSTLQKRRMAEG